MEVLNFLKAAEQTKALFVIRTWIETGELAVKGEGVENAVGDAFNYTVQYVIYTAATGFDADPLTLLCSADFKQCAITTSPTGFIKSLINARLIKENETLLQQTIIDYMGGAS